MVPALSFAEARQTRGCSEFQGFAQLVLRGSNRLTEPVLSPLLMRPEQRKFAVEAQQFGLLTKLIAPLGKGQALIKRLPGIIGSAGLNVSVAENAEEAREPYAGTDCPVSLKSPCE